MAVGVLQLPLPALQLLGSLLLPLQPPDVVHRGLQNGSLIPAHVSGGFRRQGSTVRVSWSADRNSTAFFYSFILLFFSSFLFRSTMSNLRTVGCVKWEGGGGGVGGDEEEVGSHTYGSFDLGIKVPSSLIRSLMLNLRLRSTERVHRENILS